MGPQLVDALEDECDDALAALAWIKEQSVVDADRIAMIGSSYGGVMVMLAARRGAAFRAGVSFAGPSITWPDAPALQAVLVDAMRSAEVPLFLVQAADDVHLTPTYVLGAELARAGKVREVAHLQHDWQEPRRRSRRLQQRRRLVATRHRAVPVALGLDDVAAEEPAVGWCELAHGRLDGDAAADLGHVGRQRATKARASREATASRQWIASPISSLTS